MTAPTFRTRVFQRTCWTLECEDCGSDWSHGMDYAPHFPSQPEAVTEATKTFGFVRGDDGAFRCEECAKLKACKDRGRHQWRETTGPKGTLRWCSDCGDTERLTEALLPPGDAPTTQGRREAAPHR